MTRFAFTLPLILLGLPPCAPSAAAQTERPTDAHTVYRLAVDFVFFNDRVADMTDEPVKRPELLVIADTTGDVLNRIMLPNMRLKLVPMLQYMFPAARPDLIERFAAAIKLRERPDLPPLRVPVTFLTAAAGDSLFKDGGADSRAWRRFRARYPGAVGITEVSPVAIGADGGQALLYIGTQRDYVDGQGFVLFFERRDGAWRLIAHQSLWVS